MTSPEIAGVIPVDKPPGPTSHGVVAIARRSLGTRRVGHTGTLDPFASGLLLLCVGRATRIAEYLSGLPKTYRALARLGEQTDTLDPTGLVTDRSDGWRDLTRDQVGAALAAQLGHRLQTPPLYSAKSVAGERLYQRARRGEAVTPRPVPVQIMDLRLLAWDPPHAAFEATCSSGTYVRAIARDLGLDLGVFAHLRELRRTAIGAHTVAAAVSLERLAEGSWASLPLDPLAALSHLPSIAIEEADAVAIRCGRAIRAPAGLTGDPVLVVWRGELLAVGRAADGVLQPRKVLADG